MPSFLGDYTHAAKNREEKFLRAINSVRTQSYDNKLLVVVSDGCLDTVRLCNELKLSGGYGFLHLLEMDKQPYMSGSVRETGKRFAIAEGAELITYLDSDDYLLKNHLENINNAFFLNPRCAWIWYDDLLRFGYQRRHVRLERSKIGTSNISHRSGCEVIWGDGYGHDWDVIRQLISRSKGHQAAFASYVVCHIPGRFDL